MLLALFVNLALVALLLVMRYTRELEKLRKEDSRAHITRRLQPHLLHT